MWIPWSCFVAATLLLLATYDLPIGYYTFLRIAVCIVAACAIWHESNKRRSAVWFILLGAIAVLFNPVIPVHLGSRDLWVPFNLASAALLIVYAVRELRKRRVNRSELF